MAVLTSPVTLRSKPQMTKKFPWEVAPHIRIVALASQAALSDIAPILLMINTSIDDFLMA